MDLDAAKIEGRRPLFPGNAQALAGVHARWQELPTQRSLRLDLMQKVQRQPLVTEVVSVVGFLAYCPDRPFVLAANTNLRRT